MIVLLEHTRAKTTLFIALCGLICALGLLTAPLLAHADEISTAFNATTQTLQVAAATDSDADLDEGTYIEEPPPIAARLYIRGKEDYSYAYQVLSKVNAERKKRGLTPLVMDRDLLHAAMQRAAESTVLFSHTRPNGTICMSISDKVWGENIALGQSSASSVMKSWMSSSGHKANILGENYTTIGVGCFKVDGYCYWVQVFGVDTPATLSKPGNKTVTHAVDYSNAVGKLKLSIKNKTIKKGKKKAIKIVCKNGFFPVTVQSKGFKFKSSKKKVLKVTSKGKLVAKKKGKAKITATVKIGTAKVKKTIKVK